VPWHLRGAITSSTQFARTIGGAVGVALLGSLLNARLRAAIPAAVGSASAAGTPLDATAADTTVDSLISALLNVGTRAALPPDVVRDLSVALADSLHQVYVALSLLALLGLGQVLLFARSGQRQPLSPESAGRVPVGVTPAGAWPSPRR
jgi:hypothetical protein